MTALLSLIHPTPSLGQRQLAAEMGVSLGKANYIHTPAGLEEKTRITHGILNRKEVEFGAIEREIASLKSELESPTAQGHQSR